MLNVQSIKNKIKIMKKLKLVIFSLLLTAASSAQQSTNIELPRFSKIKVEGIATIYLSQDSIQSVRSSGDSNFPNQLSVEDGTLIIDNIATNALYITLPEIDKITVEGRGDIIGQTVFSGEEMKFVINGTGKIKMDVTVNKVGASVPGLGKIELSGTADEAEFKVSGSGKIDASQLRVKKCNADVSGVGKIMVDVSDELNSNISGSGSVVYKTKPAILNSDVSGMGKVKQSNDTTAVNRVDTTKVKLGESEIWFLGKGDSLKKKAKNTKPIWAGFELGVNSYLDNNGSFNLIDSKEKFELKQSKSVSVSLNILQQNIELGRSNIWLFTGLGVTWNNYRFANDVRLTKSDFTSAYKIDNSGANGINQVKSKLVSSYLMAPVMLEFFTSRNYNKAFHLGAGGMFGLLIGSHTKYKVENNGETEKLKDFSSYNLNPFRYGFRLAIGYKKVNLFADYYASTLFKDKKGPVLFPVNAGITVIGF